MSRNAIIAVIVSLLVHSGTAASSFFFREKAAAPVTEPEIPTVALFQPPPAEPEVPETVDDAPADAPVDLADLAPPTQADIPSAVITSDFVQKPQPVVQTNLARASVVIPIQTRPSAATGFANIFNIADLDQRIEPRVRINPVYPYDLKRSGITGEVVVGFIVDTNGDVRDPYIVKSTHSGFEESALQAVLKWKFKPGRKGGVAVNTRVALPLGFNLEA